MTSKNLPPMCAARLPSTNAGIIIKRGESGYYQPRGGVDVERYNELRNVTKPQQEAMFAGSMFGWSVPAADPACYRDNGDFDMDLYAAVKGAS